MFENLFKAATSLAELADAVAGVAVQPVKDGAEFITESLREIAPPDDPPGEVPDADRRSARR